MSGANVVLSADDRARRAARQRAYYARNKDKVKEYVAGWQKANRHHVNARNRSKAAKERREEDLPEYLQLCRKGLKRCVCCNQILPRDAFSPSAADGKARLGACRTCRNKRIASDPAKVLKRRISVALRAHLIGKKSVKTERLLGYSADELCAHLELQFLPGMGWHNMAEWHIDHIVPLSSFSISGEDDPELRRAWALTNLRPIWAKDNLRKGSSLEYLL